MKLFLVVNGPASAVMADACLLLAVGLVLCCSRQLVGTTLIGPRNWLVLALVLNLLTEKWLQGNAAVEPGMITALRFVAATALFCPTVSVLGAKRPQHQAWHAIVFSLWVVLALPAAEGYFVRHSAALEVHDARGWFLWILIAVGLFNYLPTRHGLAASCGAAAQALLLSAHLPLWRAAVGPIGRNVAFALIAAALALVVWRSCRRDPVGLNRVWTDFRDAYGTVWSLRVMDRLNQTSRLAKWPISFGWQGIVSAPAAQQAEYQAGVLRAMRTVLRRFVSDAWMQQRLEGAAENAQPATRVPP